MLSFECIKNEKSVYFLLTSAGGNYFVQGYKDIWNMGTDLGNEFPDGDLLSDVLLRTAG